MSDLGQNDEGKKKKFRGDPLKSPGSFGSFGGLFVLQGVISLLWGFTKNSLGFGELKTADQLTAISTQSTAEMAICIYGLICIIGGILMIGVDNIIETLKPTGRKPTVKGWITSVIGAAFVSAIIMLPFFIRFSIIKH
jgi:hypothetical protein